MTRNQAIANLAARMFATEYEIERARPEVRKAIFEQAKLFVEECEAFTGCYPGDLDE